MYDDRQGAAVLSGMTARSLSRKGFASYLNEGKIRANDSMRWSKYREEGVTLQDQCLGKFDLEI